MDDKADKAMTAWAGAAAEGDVSSSRGARAPHQTQPHPSQLIGVLETCKDGSVILCERYSQMSLEEICGRTV